jgi:hypothetical protein
MPWSGAALPKILEWLDLVETANPDESGSSRWPTATRLD